MDGYEDKRRGFLRKLGFTLGASLTASSMISANIIKSDLDMSISADQKDFMHHYEKWMDEFIAVIRIQKVDPENIENNKNLVLLSERAKKWQTRLHEYMKDENGIFPVERIFSEIMGNTSMIVASEYLSTARNGKGVILGSVTGISPTEVVILGSGTAAEFAARTALALGATVKVFDDSISKLVDFQSRLGSRVFTSVFHPKALRKAMKTAEVVIGALSMNEVPKMIVPEEMVEGMKVNSIIIDLNIIQGGCIETSRITNHKKPTYVEHGVIHYCVPNITSRVARTTSIAVSNILAPMLLEIGQSGGINQYVKTNRGFCEGIYVFNGVLTNQDIGAVLNIPVTDINLLMAAF